ncbi:hypothetical protein GUITHDRAFT_151758 [Guillardia theta CCMP2712]|uniref:Uncharacterized protein n=1 Tax=Guillardia theta (strain CCMP2712) TaxID=905079 RepID=L1JIX5_GUITC|nr:hypothetical protein GUITHDRAFT_151758 [Guillardia theta CCMP2712]EKX48473.1 hypothetical protein GUITHDRAFT_151758 [Guillardia theta CCMP2712]|mmetsp:Transcript_14489/g.49483  ORF Transcript_14489/g.49483 Transcript_14489/m.49483 type:complete len:125 (+) Transcript_14489:176-550(+)|eukprot:XP_005835453.1 hypothetical protein GUITHDRAFT_151758 [Guillardia theta CCMP2712]
MSSPLHKDAFDQFFGSCPCTAPVSNKLNLMTDFSIFETSDEWIDDFDLLNLVPHGPDCRSPGKKENTEKPSQPIGSPSANLSPMDIDDQIICSPISRENYNRPIISPTARANMNLGPIKGNFKL